MMFAKKVHVDNNRQNKTANNHAGGNNGKAPNNSARARKGKVSSTTSRVREKLTTTSGKIKVAPAFHSDQLNQLKRSNTTTGQPQHKPAPRRSADAAEADMVRLANQ